MAGGTAIAQAAYNNLDSNKPIQEHKSNTAIMATSIGSGLAMGVGTELFFNRGYHYLNKNQETLKKKWPFGKTPEDKASRVNDLLESFRTTAHGTNEEIVDNTLRSMDKWVGRLNDGKVGQSDLYKKARSGTEKLMSSKLAANSIAVGMSTTKGRIFNYGIGTAMSVVAGGMAIHSQNKKLAEGAVAYDAVK